MQELSGAQIRFQQIKAREKAAAIARNAVAKAAPTPTIAANVLKWRKERGLV